MYKQLFSILVHGEHTQNILHIGGLIDFENGGNICAIILVLRIQITILSLHTFRFYRIV